MMLELIVKRARIAGALFFLLALLPVHAVLADYRTWPAPFPERTISAIEAALNKSFAQTRAPGVVVGIWIPGEGTYVRRRASPV